jgi:hypothetical protein
MTLPALKGGVFTRLRINTIRFQERFWYKNPCNLRNQWTFFVSHLLNLLTLYGEKEKGYGNWDISGL